MISHMHLFIINLTTMTAAARVIITLSFLGILSVLGLQVIPERAKVVSFNKKFVSNITFYIKRYHRRGNYYTNLEGTTHHVWNNNITIHFIFYEYLHNEYKRSFVEMHFKFCDMVKNDPYVGQAVVAAGISCPMISGPKKFQNISVPANEFPHVWPFERCKVDIKVHQTFTEELIVNLEIYLMFKQKSHT